jgi:transcriptional regulator with GAF, ATPase, and Fis domain
MTINDMAFFHQATIRICGSLEIDRVMEDCFEYLRQFIPLDAIYMNTYDPDLGAILSIANKSEFPERWRSPVVLSPEARAYVEEPHPTRVEISNHPENHVIGRLLGKSMKIKDFSVMVMFLEIDEEDLGVVEFVCKGRDRYFEEHARLLELLHDPFAVAMSNTLRYQELIKLKDLLADDNRYLNRELHHMSGDEIVGEHFGLSDVMEMVRQVAPLDSHALLLGETGVGKEVIANAIHYSSPRSGGPFIKVNCGAIPESLLDSELFGHEKGAFTGAIAQKRGRFERAHQGSIFLDEIGELPPQAQVRLLRVIQNKEIERVGGDKPIPVDIRIITATHRNLEELVREGRFREDLWYRMNVFPITVPPLRQRLSDIPALVNYFIERKSRQMNLQSHPVLVPGAIERLQSYHWPGNVRELENAVERALIRSRTASQEEPLSFDDFTPTSSNYEIQTVPDQQLRSLNLDEAVKDHIQTVLKRTGGKVQGKNGAAALMGVNPSTLRNRMRKLGIPFGRKRRSKDERSTSNVQSRF